MIDHLSHKTTRKITRGHSEVTQRGHDQLVFQLVKIQLVTVSVSDGFS